ncbi:MAG TPA: hypothetical protein VEU53_02475 [Stellaceae bacterium]|nr:hypothetical protein [Stellaceae bacterium]
MNQFSIELDHAWKWFEFHAAQRMTVFRFYLIMVGALGAGYIASLKDDHVAIALIIAVFGAIASVLFWRLDQRVSDLIKHGENALSQIENQLAQSSGISDIKIIIKTEQKSKWPLNSYRRIFRTIFIMAFCCFLIAAIVPVYRAINATQVASEICTRLAGFLK